jgi:hypothetical protein
MLGILTIYDRVCQQALLNRLGTNAGSLFDELLGDAQSDALPAAGDNANLTFE